MTAETPAAPPDPLPYRLFDSRLRSFTVGTAACLAWNALLVAACRISDGTVVPLVAAVGATFALAMFLLVLASGHARSEWFLGVALVYLAGLTASVALVFWVLFVGPL